MATLYVLFFIELGSRGVYLAGRTASPNSAWVAQQTRQIVWRLSNEPQSICFLIHDRDSKFTAGFDHIFASEGIEIFRTPYRAPKANAVAESWVCTVRQESLDQLLIFSQRHLARVLKECIDYHKRRVRIKDWTNNCRSRIHDRDAAQFEVVLFSAGYSTVTTVTLLDCSLS